MKLLDFFNDSLTFFDDFLTDLPTLSTSSYSTAIWVVLVDESIDELLEHRGEWHGYRTEALDETPSPPTPTPPFLSLVVDSVLLEVFNIKVSGAAIRLNS